MLIDELNMTQDAVLDRRAKESIHSGHFMVSDFDDCEESTAVAALPVDANDIFPLESAQPSEHNVGNDNEDHTAVGGFDFQSACKETATTYKFGSRSSQAISIDASLSKLFQCMTLAYSGKLTSPRWKNFKGMKLKWKEKIRLNNVIWRAWHLQFVVSKSPLVCQFATPIDDGHLKPQAVVLEGTYWKRKMESVIAEYKNWRTYHKHRICALQSGETVRKPPSSSTLAMTVDDDALMDFSDTLFSSLTQPFAFPNPREIARGGGLADFIQPGLTQLQPNLDDFMDTFEPLSEFLSIRNLLSDEVNAFTNIQPQPCIPELQLPANQTEPSIYGTAHSSSSAPVFSADQSNNCYSDFTQNQCHVVENTNYVNNQTTSTGSNFGYSGQNVECNDANAAISCTINHDQTVFQSNAFDSVSSAGSQPVFCLPKMPTNQSANRRASAPAITTSKSTNRHGSNSAKVTRLRPIAAHKTVSNGLELSNQPPLQATVISPSLPQNNTVLAQVIPQGACYGTPPTTMAIINTSTSQAKPSSAMAPTVIISPVTLATMTGMTDFQSRMLVGAANQVFTPSANQPHLTVDFSAQSSCSTSAKPTGGCIPKQAFDISQVSSRTKSDAQVALYKEHRRVVHTNAEQKRRFNIKYGFDVIQKLVPSISENANAKISKAQMLHKAAEYIKHLKTERTEVLEETEMLKKRIQGLNDAINLCQRQLPITGAPQVANSSTNMSSMFDEYVRQNTLQNWKFWIFSIIIRPIFEKYDSIVNTSSMEEFCQSVLSWLDQYCSLVFLRPAVSNSLRLLSTTTDILANPSSIELEATKAVSKGHHPHNH